MSKAYRYANEGSEKTRTGAKIINFDKDNPIHIAEMAAQAMGFRPTRTAQTWDRLIMQREAEAFWGARRGVLYDQYQKAKDSGGTRAEVRAQVAEVRKAVNRFNQTVPYSGLKVSREALDRSYKQRTTNRLKTENNQPNAKMMTEVYDDIRRLHPEMNVFEENLPRGR